jgi:radical SAM protein with 4Fe4S-binding SPASM domain
VKFHQQKSFSFREQRLQKFDLKEIEIVFSRNCNLSCSFCPQSNKEYRNKLGNEFLDKNYLIKLLNELQNKNIFYEIAGFGEPFLHPEFKNLINIFEQKIKKGFYTIITNGILLKKYFKEYYQFFKTKKYLKEIKISCYTDDIYNFFKKKKINWITVKDSRPENLNLSLFNNRAGSVSKFNKNIKYSSCNYIFFFLTLDTNGDILPCPHEWERRLVLGNIKNNTIQEIWNNKKANYLRKLFIENKRQEIYPCNICTAPGTLIGGKAKNDWKENYSSRSISES